MRLAVLPITSFRHLKGESEVVMFTSQIREWVHNHEDTWVYFILPEDCRPQTWVGEVEQWPRTTCLWIDRLGLYYDKVTEIPGTYMQYFNMRNGLYQIDGLVTSRRAAAVSLQREAWDHRLKSIYPVFIDESMTVEWGLTPSTVSNIEIVAQTLGCAVGWPVFDTQAQLDNAVAAARHWLAGKRILEVMQKAVVIPCGIDVNRVDRIVQKAMAEQGVTEWRDWKADRFTCFFGGRLNRGSKRADQLIKEYDSLFRFGRDMQITVCSPKDEGWMLEFIKKEYPEIQVLVQTPSDEFVQRASKAHVFFNTSKHEGFSVGFTEMMYMTKYGTVLVAPREAWVKGIMQEHFDSYPFLYEDFDQARVMLRWIFDNYDQAAQMAMSHKLWEMIRERYDSVRTAEEHWQHYKKITDQENSPEFIRNLMGEANRALCMEAYDALPAEFTIGQMYQEMIDRSRAMKDDPRRGQTTRWAVRRWLIQEGLCRDTYTTPEPTLAKLGR